MFGKRIENIYRLGIKELFSLRRDVVLLILICWAFSFAIYNAATGFSHDLKNASIAIADLDKSKLSRQIGDAFLQPFFNNTPVKIAATFVGHGQITAPPVSRNSISNNISITSGPTWA